MANDASPQNFSNHTRFDPPFHFFILPVALANVIIAIVHTFKVPTWTSGCWIVTAIAAFMVAGKTRGYALIRSPVNGYVDNLRLRIGELSDTQLIGLRFASDTELPALVQRALAENLSRKDIKKSVTNWRADSARV